MKLILLILLTLIPLMSASCAQKTNSQNHITRVIDSAGVMSTSDSLSLDSLCREAYEEELATICFIIIDTVPTLASSYDNNFQQYATEIANSRKIGRKGKDDGLLFIASVKDRQWAISTGYDTEWILHDSTCSRIGREIIIPEFRKGNYGKGFLDAAKESVVIMRRNKMHMYPEKYDTAN